MYVYAFLLSFRFIAFRLVIFGLDWLSNSEHFDDDSILAFKNARTLLHYAFFLASEKSSTHNILCGSVHFLRLHTSVFGALTRERSQCNSTYTLLTLCVVPKNIFIVFFRLWACDCQCGMNEIRHGHIYMFFFHSIQNKKKTMWRSSFFLRQLTSHLFNALSVYLSVRSFFFICVRHVQCMHVYVCVYTLFHSCFAARLRILNAVYVFMCHHTIGTIHS